MISWGHVVGTCRAFDGADACRYLVSTHGGWVCAKNVSYVRRRIDERVEREEMTALGDNCPGWKEEES